MAEQKKEERVYITPAGAARLQAEFRKLKFEERPEVVKVVEWAASLGDRSENADYQYGKRKLREIDKRLHFLTKRLAALEVVDPKSLSGDVVMFGATVTVRDESDTVRKYSIVGADEVDATKGRISLFSPIGKALMRKKADDIVEFEAPAGTREIEILCIEYVEIV